MLFILLAVAATGCLVALNARIDSWRRWLQACYPRVVKSLCRKYFMKFHFEPKALMGGQNTVHKCNEIVHWNYADRYPKADGVRQQTHLNAADSVGQTYAIETCYKQRGCLVIARWKLWQVVGIRHTPVTRWMTKRTPEGRILATEGHVNGRTFVVNFLVFNQNRQLTINRSLVSILY